jgi:hypothetical protein
MYLSRKSVLPLTLVVGLFGTPTLPAVTSLWAPSEY